MLRLCHACGLCAPCQLTVGPIGTEIILREDFGVSWFGSGNLHNLIKPIPFGILWAPFGHRLGPSAAPLAGPSALGHGAAPFVIRYTFFVRVTSRKSKDQEYHQNHFKI